ncbi:(Fe-S)-binding protein [Candidatus Pacearchaeota archaeon]|nr:(Fe-S)-binding protein [Candidatus Pacearchaeota archaeon]
MGVFSFLKKSNNLFYPGCMGYYKFNEQFVMYQKIFDRLGIDYTVIDKKICCGLPALEAGYDNEARKLCRRNFEIFKEEKITDIITCCPECTKMFSYDYMRLLPDWNINTTNIWALILSILEARPRLIKSKKNEKIGIQDSCYLGRYLGNYSSPRLILNILGYEVVEIKDNREDAICSGSCGGLPRTNPELSKRCAEDRLMSAKRRGIKKLVVFSLYDYKLLKDNSKNSRIEILDFSEVLADSLGINELSDDSSDEVGVEIEDQ